MLVTPLRCMRNTFAYEHFMSARQSRVDGFSHSMVNEFEIPSHRSGRPDCFVIMLIGVMAYGARPPPIQILTITG